MKLFKRISDARTERKRLRQENRTERAALRNASRSIAYGQGIDVSAAGTISSGLGSVADGFASYMNAQSLGGILGGSSSGQFNTGSFQSSGFIPIVLAVGAVLFALVSFGGLFSKKKR